MNRVLLLAQTAAMTLSSDAFGSQGPGTAAGSASSNLQTSTAIVVYGLCALTLVLAVFRSVTRR